VTHSRGQTNNLSPSLQPQIRTHYATNTCSEHFPLVVEKYSGVVVKTNEAAVRSPHWFARANDDSASYVSSAYFHRIDGSLGSSRDRSCFLDDDYNLIANGAPAVGDFVFENVNTLDNECPRVIYNLDVVNIIVTKGGRLRHTLRVLLRPIIV